MQDIRTQHLDGESGLLTLAGDSPSSSTFALLKIRKILSFASHHGDTSCTWSHLIHHNKGNIWRLLFTLLDQYDVEALTGGLIFPR